MTKKFWRCGLGLLVLFALIQLIPVDRSNPPVTAELSASNQLMTIFRRSCYDCHSNETVWPWYSRIAPLSWLVAYDTWEGREHLNFSTWGELSPRKRLKLKKELWEEVADGGMPPWLYLLNHLEADLTSAERLVIHDWTATP